MQPIGKLNNVPVNIGDIWVLEDFIIVDIPETDDAQIILGRPILATAGYHIDMRVACVSFEVEGRFAVFSRRKKNVISPHSSILGALSLFPEIDMEDVLNFKILLILTGFLMRTPTKGMLRWSLLPLCHLQSQRLRLLFLMSLQ